MKYLLLFVIALCTACVTMAQAQTWTSLIGPQVASNVKDISITSSGSTLYIADANHVLKSTNDGAGWAVTSQPYSSPLLVLVKPNDGSIVHAAKNGFLSRSTDGGASWANKIEETALTPLRLVAAVNDNTIMLLGRTFVSGNNAIWRSDNSGASWSKVTTFGAATNVHDFDTYPTAGQGRNGVILAGGINPSGAPEGSSNSSPATTSGLWKSADYGANWDQNGLGNRNVRSVAIVPKPSGTDYIRLAADNVATGNDALMRNTSLTDDGQWTQITLSPAPADIYLIRRKASNGNIFLAASNGVWKSTNDGTSFSQVGLTGTDVISLAVSATGDNVFAGTASTIYKSTDNGSTWTNVGDMDVSSVEAAQISTTQYSWAVTKDNNIAARYNGTSWERKTIGNEGVQFSTENIYRNPSTGKLFAAGALGSTGALYSSTNDGASYTQVSITNYTLQTGSRYHGTVRDASGVMYAFGGGSLASGGSGWRNLFNSTDEGATWNVTYDIGGSNLVVYDIVGPTSGTLYAAASNGNVYVSTGGPTNWSAAVDVGTVARSIAVNPAYPTIVYAGGDGGLWKYNGTSWSQVASSTIINVMKVMMHPSYQGSSDYVWVVSSGGTKVYKTTNGGTNWTDFSSGVTTPITSLGDDGVNKGYSYLATAGGVYSINEAPALPTNFAGTVYGSHASITWNLNGESDGVQYQVWRYDQACNYYCPNKSCGAWTNLTTLGTASSNSWYDATADASVCPGGGFGIIGLLGYYIKAIDNGGNLSGQTSSYTCLHESGNQEKRGDFGRGVPTRFFLNENYPNPFNPVTTINYALPEDVQVKLTVVDALGREVSILVNEKQTAGFKSVRFDASQLATGVYLYKLSAGIFTDVKKLLLLK